MNCQYSNPFLSAPTHLLNSSQEFIDFFDTTSGSLIGYIYTAEELLTKLYDTSTNTGNFATRYEAAEAANNLISGGEPWEMNEKTVNNMWLALSNTPYHLIDSNLVFAIQELASSCPFIEGTAVYRARPLWAIWEPAAVFDDRIICLAGMNKNGANGPMNLDSLIKTEMRRVHAFQQNLLSDTDKIIVKPLLDADNYIQVFPNPASTQLTISYNSAMQGEFFLYDVAGRVVLNTMLDAKVNKVSVQLPPLSNGVYSYRCRFEGGNNLNGLITIQKL